jgi:hypothetical protein
MSKTHGSTWKNSAGYTHYQNHKDYYIQRAQLNKDRNFKYVEDIKKRSKCTDCGNNDYRVLEFDHLPQFEKIGHIATLIRKGWTIQRLDTEIAKCDIVCANCHKIRTWARKQMPS